MLNLEMWSKAMALSMAQTISGRYRLRHSASNERRVALQYSKVMVVPNCDLHGMGQTVAERLEPSTPTTAIACQGSEKTPTNRRIQEQGSETLRVLISSTVMLSIALTLSE